MSTKKKNADYLKQGGILAMASLIVRIIGMVYRIPMSNILGEEGNGIYAVAFEIYDLILIISSYSLPLALSKMISARQANREHKNTGRILKVALRFAIISGGAFALILFFGAGVIEHTIYPEYSGVQIPLRVLAPTIFIVALLGVFRGFFQGKRTMIPTAVSQIIEQVVNAIVSVAASYLFMKWNADSLQQAAWGAAGGTLGTCLGAASALLLVMFVYWLYRPVQAKLRVGYAAVGRRGYGFCAETGAGTRCQPDDTQPRFQRVRQHCAAGRNRGIADGGRRAAHLGCVAVGGRGRD